MLGSVTKGGVVIEEGVVMGTGGLQGGVNF